MTYDCDVLVVGGGPVGLFLTAELGMRGVSVKMFDEKPGTSTHPAANANSARTMEHYRRLGISKEIRALGLPHDHPTDVAYYTRLSEYELARLPLPSSSDVIANVKYNEFTWATPEPPHRCSQLYIEPVLRKAAESYSCTDVQFGTRVVGLEQDADSVIATVTTADTGTKTYRAKYLVGCDGPRSTVRGLLGFKYVGGAGEKREFMGGRMTAAYFNAPALAEMMKDKQAWQYWTLNQTQRALIVAVNGRDSFIILTQLAEGETFTPEEVHRSIQNAVGLDIPFDILSHTTWTAGFALVAEKMRQDRVFLAGDAAHLFTPTGGLGYNTGIEDAANLAWKLEALSKGFGGDKLADSYEAERRPAATRNTGFAREFADSIGTVRLPKFIDDAGARGDTVRKGVGDYLNFHARKEFVIPGVQFGTRYEGSPIVATESGTPPPDTANMYLPVGRPGHRAPHVWLDDDSSLYDCFGPGFTLLSLGTTPGAPLGISNLTNVAVNSAEARDLYGADYVLIRPDQHIAWRGNAIDQGFIKILRQALGIN